PVGPSGGRRHRWRTSISRRWTGRDHQPGGCRWWDHPSRQPCRWSHCLGGERAMRILICEDSVLLREGLVRLLEHSVHEVSAALPDTTELKYTLTTDMPHLAILDERLPPTYTDEGIRAALQIRRTYPHMPLLVLSQYD